MIRHRRPPNPLDIMGLPAEVADACLRCLDTDPLRRPTAAALAATLHTAAPAAPAESLTQLPGVAPTVATPITFTGPTEVKALRRQHRTRHRSHGRTAALAAGVAACGLLTWLLAGWTPTAPIDQPQALGPAAPAPTGIDCQVLYRVSAGGGTAYTADLTVTNLGPRQIGPDWQLRLTMPDAQPMHLPADGKWHQDGATVIFHSVDGALPTGRSRQMTVTGAGAAPLPDTFRLNENACAATVTLASPTGSGAAAPTVPETVGRNTEDDGKPERKPAPKPKPPNNAAASKAR